VTEVLAPAPGRWFRPARIDQDAPVRLFLFHCAGGSASMYRDWPATLPDDVACQCVQLPGRQDRLSEPAFDDIEPLVDAVRDQWLTEADDRPYAFFGHSMGALVAYRLAVAIERSGDVGPVLLGAAAWAPRGFRVVRPELADLPESEVLDWIRRLGAVPAQVYQDPALLSLVLPVMRSDVAVYASYVDDGAMVGCPVVTYSAAADPLGPTAAMRSWCGRTRYYLGNREYPGGHFFINEHTLAIATDFTRLLRRQVI
jgi:surfactin synthase thioesterase subunit